MLGKFNTFVLKLGTETQFNGDASENDIAGMHTLTPFKCKLIKVKAVADTIVADKTATIQVYAGSSKSGTAVLSSGIALTSASTKGSGTIAAPDKMYAEDQEFCLSENSTAGSNVVGLSVELTFRQYEP